MTKAIRLSRTSVVKGFGGPFGALVVKDGSILATGCNRVLVDADPTAHAEIVAIRNACKALRSFSLAGCALFSSCEPCPMCLAAVYWSRIETVYFANTRHDAKAIGFADAHLYNQLAGEASSRGIKMVQLMRDEAQAAFQLWADTKDKTPY